MKKLILAAIAASVAMPVFAAPIIGSATGLANPATTITFDEVALAGGQAVTTQYAPYGITFSSGIYYSPQTGFPNINGNDVGNFPGPKSNPITISFASALTEAAFAIVSNNSSYTFTALLNGSAVDSFSSNVGYSSPNDFYGFSGISFDAIQINSASSDSFLIDNVQLGAAPAVPEPASWAMFIGGFGLVGALARRKKANVRFA